MRRMNFTRHLQVTGVWAHGETGLHKPRDKWRVGVRGVCISDASKLKWHVKTLLVSRFEPEVCFCEMNTMVF